MQYSENVTTYYKFSSDQNKNKIISNAFAFEQKTGQQTNTFAAIDDVRYAIPSTSKNNLILILFS